MIYITCKCNISVISNGRDFILDTLKGRKITGPADLIPALVRQPVWIRVGDVVLKANTPSKQEHKFRVLDLLLSP